MDLWMFSTLLLACCLVAAVVGWCMARLAYWDLAARVASMEAAITAYWDRIRKRMRVEQAPEVRSVESLTEAEIMDIGRKAGLVQDDFKRR